MSLTHETIETLSGLHTLRPVTRQELAALIRAAFAPSVASAMLGEIDSQPEAKDARAGSVEPKAGSADSTGNVRAAKLRALADAMQGDIDSKRNPATANQNLTRRRMDIIDGMRRDAEKLEQTQHALYALAEAHESGTIGRFIAHVSSRKAVDDILHGWERTEVKDVERNVLHAFMANYKPVNAEEKAAEEPRRGIREREKRAALAGIPGFFPTPSALSARLVALADIKPGMRVLEPSAGAGHLADEIMRQCPNVGDLHCIEPSYTLRDILVDKGHKVGKFDIMNMEPGTDTSLLYDRVIMNPPFENGQDIDHIRHAYQLLKPGGILAAILCEGPFYRTDSKSVSFRFWLEQYAEDERRGNFAVGCPIVIVNEKNPDGSFEKSDRPTGVATRTLVLQKPD